MDMSDAKTILVYVLVYDKQKRIHTTNVSEMPVDNAFVPADEAFIVLFPARGHYIFLPLVVTSSVTAGVPFISCSTSLDVTADV